MSEYTEHIYKEFHGREYTPICQLEEITRCKDCIYYQVGIYKNVTCELTMCHVERSDFCSQAERKDYNG